MRPSFWALVVALGMLRCVSPRPSAEPLGWGPLPAGALKAPHRSKSHDVSGAQSKTTAAVDRTSSGDAGSPEPEKTALAPSASPSQASPESKPGSPASVPPLASFVGDYAGQDVATYRISGLPDRTERDPKARITVKSSNDSGLLFVLIDSSNGKEICTLSGTKKDSGIEIGPGQKCFEQSEGDVAAGATVKKGNATLEKDKLVFELDLDFEMKVEGRKLSGGLDYRFEGKRQ